MTEHLQFDKNIFKYCWFLSIEFKFENLPKTLKFFKYFYYIASFNWN